MAPVGTGMATVQQVIAIIHIFLAFFRILALLTVWQQNETLEEESDIVSDTKSKLLEFKELFILIINKIFFQRFFKDQWKKRKFLNKNH